MALCVHEKKEKETVAGESPGFVSACFPASSALCPLLNRIVDLELQEDRENDRPERSKSEILEMVLRKGAHAWEQIQKKSLG